MGKLALILLLGCTAKRFEESKADLARLEVRKLAQEAYPMWSIKHVDKPCPDSLDELKEFVPSFTGEDPWGTPYRTKCERGLSVDSAGPDKKFDTPDDVHSRD